MASTLEILIVIQSLFPAFSSGVTPISYTSRSPQSKTSRVTPSRRDESTQWTQTFNASAELQKEISRNMSEVLDVLLRGYDKSLRPEKAGEPLTVKIDLNIRSMGPISEKDMMFSLDCYFRQTWQDFRLKFSPLGNIKILAFSNAMIDEIWRPDVYFMNGKGSYLHTITSPNRLLRIRADGQILYSSRLTVKTSCPMHLRNYPMDSQACPLKIASFGYPDKELILRWKYGENESIISSPEVILSQFELTGIDGWANNISYNKRDTHSVLVAEFRFKRRMGFFLIQMYIPSVLLVLISWVAFWINREATGDRIALGVTTVLTMAFLSIDNRTDLPKVSYATALDVFVSICFAFILASILEFAGVHFFTKVNSGEYVDIDNEDDVSFTVGGEKLNNFATIMESTEALNGFITQEAVDQSIHVNLSPRERIAYACSRVLLCFKGIATKEFPTNNYKRNHANSVSKIDKCARILFPLAFVFFNTFYWKSYLEMPDAHI